LLPAALVLTLITGCSWEWAYRIYPIPFYKVTPTVAGADEKMSDRSRRIAILPFTFEQKDDEERREAVRILRETFERSLERLRSHEVVDLAEVDRKLEEAGIDSSLLARLPPQLFKDLLGADVVMYGHVKRTRNVTLYLYSHTVYEGTFRLVDSPTGEILWVGRLWEGHRAGLFVEAFVADMFMSQPRNRELSEAYQRVASRMVSRLVETIPEPLSSDEVAPELQ
jgi:hypothetical protein